MSNHNGKERLIQHPEQGLTGGVGLLRPLAISALVTSLLMGLVVIIRLVAPDLVWAYLPGAIFLITLEAVLTSRWLEHPDRRQVSRTAYRLSELTVIVVLLRLLTWSLTGGLPGPELLRRYFLSPLSILDGAFFGYLLCGILAWERGIRFGSLFLRMDVSHVERAFYSLPQSEQKKQYGDRPIPYQRTHVFGELTKSWLSGGLILGLFAALTTIDLPAVEISGGIRNIARLGLPPEMIGALLVYFILGLWLISQARLEMMRARWLADNVSQRSKLEASWRRTSLILLTVAAFLAAFLPIGTAPGASTVLQALLAVMLAVMRFIFLLFSIPLFLLLSLFGVNDLPREQRDIAPELPTPPPAQASGPIDETTALIAGGTFWALVVFVAIAALYFFLQDRGQVPRLEWLGRWWQGFMIWLRLTLEGASKRASSLQDTVRRRLPEGLRGTGRAGGVWPSLRLGSLPPRSQIRYFYLSAVRRATEKGVPREDSKTPSEYAQDLKENWPEAEEEIEGLTGAFLQARYSSEAIEAREVGPVKRLWKRVRGMLRRSASGGSQRSSSSR